VSKRIRGRKQRGRAVKHAASKREGKTHVKRGEVPTKGDKVVLGDLVVARSSRLSRVLQMQRRGC
jgi:hypothetical protein